MIFYVIPFSEFARHSIRNTLPAFTNSLTKGAGKALPSIAASILGAKQVIITDAPTVVSNIENIVGLNQIFNVEVKPLDWTDRCELRYR